MVVTSTLPGNTLRELVLLQMLASHTSRPAAASQLAQPSAPTDKPSTNTSASLAQPSKPTVLLPPRVSSNPQDQLRPVSPYMLTSSTTSQASITTYLVVLRVVTPSRSSVGVNKDPRTTGSLPTHGEPHGERVVSSRSEKVTQVSTKPLSVAPQTSPLLPQRKSSNEDSIVKKTYPPRIALSLINNQYPHNQNEKGYS